MGVELTMLAYSTALLLALVLIQSTVGVQSQGLVPMAGNRDDLPAAKPFQARTKRLVDNHREGLTIFAPLVLIAASQGSFTAMTALGAQLFFYSRVAHAVVYIAGWPMIRPLTWIIGVIGTVMILLAVLGLA